MTFTDDWATAIADAARGTGGGLGEGRAMAARMEALATEAEAGGDHPTAARIRDAIDPEETT